MDENMESKLQFVTKKDHVSAVKAHFPQVSSVFGVKIKPEKVDKDMQWICITGPEDMIPKAREYILALACPEVTSPMHKIWNHPDFTDGCRAHIERTSGAVLAPLVDDDVAIQGSELNVMIAMSLIDELFSKSVSDCFDGPNKADASLIFEGEENVFAADLQQTSKRGLEAAGRSGIDSKRKPNNPNASVICLESDDEETMVLRPVSAQTANQLDVSAIVLSSEDEDGGQECFRPDPTNSQSKNSASKTKACNSKQADIKAPSNAQSKGKQSKQREAASNSAKQTGNSGTKWRLQAPLGEKSAAAQGSVSSQMSTAASVQDTASYRNPPNCSEAAGASEAESRQAYIEDLLGAASPAKPKSGLRFIVIDGSNVAMAHGNGTVYSVRGIEICIKFFLKRGHKQIIAFVPEWRRYTNQISAGNRELLNKLNQCGFVKFTPARRTDDRTIASYDDRFILNLAVAEEGIVVSNDLFRDLQGERQSYKDIVNHRLLQYTFAGDLFMPPEDPLGRYGPPLHQFLRHPDFKPAFHAQAQKQMNAFPRFPNIRPPAHYAPAQRGAKVPKKPESSNSSPLPAHMNEQREREPSPVEDEQPQNVRLLPLRSEEDTRRLFHELTQLFPGPEHIKPLLMVLENHKREIDLEHLVNYYFNAMS